MLEKYNLRDNAWLKQLFNERKKWALVYGRKSFCGDMKSTQRSEVMNSILRRYLHRSHDLLRFFLHFERVVSGRRKAEADANFKMTQSIPTVGLEVPMLLTARNMYTPEIFKLFQEKYSMEMGCVPKIGGQDETTVMYKVFGFRKNRKYIVTFDSVEQTVACICKKFEFSGILCGHALRVFDHIDLQEVPDRYILKRRRKDAKIETESGSYKFTSLQDKVTLSLRYRELMCKSVKINTRAAENEGAFAIAIKYLDHVFAKVEEFFDKAPHSKPSKSVTHDPSDDICEIDGSDQWSSKNSIVEKPTQPTQVKEVKRKERGCKGRPRIKSSLEKLLRGSDPIDNQLILLFCCYNRALHQINSSSHNRRLHQISLCSHNYPGRDNEGRESKG